MKKIYIKPNSETVNVRLFSSVLEDPGLEGDSKYTNELGAKEQGDFFEDDNFGDLWDDGGDTGNSYDIWNE